MLLRRRLPEALAPAHIRSGARHWSGRAKQPLIVYVHPREIDPGHQRLPLGLWRSFKCYNSLGTTFPKLNWLCENNRFGTMAELAARIGRGVGSVAWEAPRQAPVCRVCSAHQSGSEQASGKAMVCTAHPTEADAELT